jgi:MraZ protein
MSMFRGHFEHAIDAKGRTSLPARFREVLGGGDLRLVVTPALGDPCLDVHPMRAWEELEARLAQLNEFDADVIAFRRLYVSAAVECDLDRQGRLLVPPSMREHAELTKDVLWAGMGQKAELWSSQLWSRAQKKTVEQQHELRASIARLLST